MFGIGPLELLIVLFIVLLIFGARRLPDMGRELGTGMREFKENIVNPVKDDPKPLPAANEAETTVASAPRGEAVRD